MTKSMYRDPFPLSVFLLCIHHLLLLGGQSRSTNHALNPCFFSGINDDFVQAFIPAELFFRLTRK